MRGADCNTDHRMIRMKLIVGRKRFYKRKCKESSVRRWDVARLKGSTEDARGRETARGRYLRCVKEKLREQ